MPRRHDPATHVQVAFFSDGRLTSLPSRTRYLLAALGVLAGRFEPGRRYPEREVNALLDGDAPDPATLRRLLVDHGFLHRTGGVYRRRPEPTSRTSGHPSAGTAVRCETTPRWRSRHVRCDLRAAMAPETDRSLVLPAPAVTARALRAAAWRGMGALAAGCALALAISAQAAAAEPLVERADAPAAITSKAVAGAGSVVDAGLESATTPPTNSVSDAAAGAATTIAQVGAPAVERAFDAARPAHEVLGQTVAPVLDSVPPVPVLPPLDELPGIIPGGGEAHVPAARAPDSVRRTDSGTAWPIPLGGGHDDDRAKAVTDTAAVPNPVDAPSIPLPVRGPDVITFNLGAGNAVLGALLTAMVVAAPFAWGALAGGPPHRPPSRVFAPPIPPG